MGERWTLLQGKDVLAGAKRAGLPQTGSDSSSPVSSADGRWPFRATCGSDGRAGCVMHRNMADDRSSSIAVLTPEEFLTSRGAGGNQSQDYPGASFWLGKNLQFFQ